MLEMINWLVRVLVLIGNFGKVNVEKHRQASVAVCGALFFDCAPFLCLEPERLNSFVLDQTPYIAISSWGNKAVDYCEDNADWSRLQTKGMPKIGRGCGSVYELKSQIFRSLEEKLITPAISHTPAAHSSYPSEKSAIFYY